MRILGMMVRGQLAAQDGVRAIANRIETADDRGASALEYAVLVGLILALVVVGVRFLGNRASTLLNSATSALS